MSQPLNAKGKPFSWSYTAWKNFEGCPARYAAEKYYCTSPFTDSEALRWGNRVHKAAERVLKGKPHKDDAAYAPVQKYVETMLQSPHKVEAETEITLTRDFKRTSWFAKDAWFRIKLDVIITKEEVHAHLFDWKTGKKIREDPDQLRLGAAALSLVRPQLEHFDGKYIWTAHQTPTGIKPIVKAEIPQIWEEFLPKVRRMEDSWKSENFPCRPSGLCPWCPVTKCPQRRGEKR